jgi:serine/threonine protein kinase
MSPEQIGNLMAKERVAKIDSRTDVFALGLVVYEMLTGQSAFTQGMSGTIVKFLHQPNSGRASLGGRWCHQKGPL